MRWTNGVCFQKSLGGFYLELWMVALNGVVVAAFEECLIQHELNAESDKKHAEVWVLRRFFSHVATGIIEMNHETTGGFGLN